jgi:hypothetical protein
MFGADGGIADLDRASGCCLSVGGPSGGVGETADVMEHGGDLGTFGSEARCQYLARGCVQLRGFVEAAQLYFSSTARSLRTRAVARSSLGRCRSAIANARR